MFKVNNRNTRKRCEICSKLTIKAPEPPIAALLSFNINFENRVKVCCQAIVFISNFEQVFELLNAFSSFPEAFTCSLNK